MKAEEVIPLTISIFVLMAAIASLIAMLGVTAIVYLVIVFNDIRLWWIGPPSFSFIIISLRLTACIISFLVYALWEKIKEK